MSTSGNESKFSFKKKKSTLTSFSEDDNSELELDPIRTDVSDSLFKTDEVDDAIITTTNVNSKK